MRQPIALLLLLTLLAAGTACGRLGDGLRSHAPPEGSESHSRLAAGPHRPAKAELSFVDDSRETPASGGEPVRTGRTLETTLWVPSDAEGALPLLVYAHGFSGNRFESSFLLSHLAGHGYAVAALDFPLTRGGAPGGPNPADLVNQPGDVRFVIDSLLALPVASLPHPGSFDEERIGLFGLSYGGLTTTLTAFHPTLSDPRIKGAVSIAGPSRMLTPQLFGTKALPFLMIAGTLDGLVPHATNAVPLPGKAQGSALLSLLGGTHLGFADIGARWLRFANHPDEAACGQLSDLAAGELQAFGNPFESLGGLAAGVDPAGDLDLCQGVAFDYAMRPQRQQQITSLGVRAFFDGLFALERAQREGAQRFLAEVLAAELPDVRYETSSAPRAH